MRNLAPPTKTWGINMAKQMPNIDKEMKGKIAMLEYTTSKTQAAIDTGEQELLLRQIKAVKTVMENCE